MQGDNPETGVPVSDSCLGKAASCGTASNTSGEVHIAMEATASNSSAVAPLITFSRRRSGVSPNGMASGRVSEDRGGLRANSLGSESEGTVISAGGGNMLRSNSESVQSAVMRAMSEQGYGVARTTSSYGGCPSRAGYEFTPLRCGHGKGLTFGKHVLLWCGLWCS